MPDARIPLVASLVLALAQAGCFGRPAEGPKVSLRMAGTPPGASVTIDDIPVGSLAIVAERGVALPPGEHHVTVVAPGYLPFDRVISSRDAVSGKLTLNVHLVQIPD